MLVNFRRLILSLVISLVHTSAPAEEMLPIEELFQEGGDRLLPWIRCAAFYQATFNLAKRHGQDSPDPELLDAENDMATIASILLIEFSGVSDENAIVRVRNEIMPVVARYEMTLIQNQRDTRVPFYEDLLWERDGAACAKMRDSVAPALWTEQ